MVVPLMTPALLGMFKRFLKKDKIGKGKKSSGPIAKKKLKKKKLKKKPQTISKAGFEERKKRTRTPKPTKLY